MKSKILDWSGYKKTAFLFFPILLAILFFLSYLIPQWYTIHINQLNFYSNAWDEANYLTHQMALALKYLPNYWFSSNIYLILEGWGISGSWQNVLFDTILVPIIFLLTIFSVKKIFHLSLSNSVFFAIIICFSSVLFSYSNHLIGDFFSYKFPDNKSFLIPSEISFPVILRTPNPVLSYFVIIASMLFYLRYKKLFILLIPLPFLYLPVFVFYLYFACAWIAYHLLHKFDFKTRTIFSNVISSFVVFALFMLLTRLQSVKDLVHFSYLMNEQAYLAAYSHRFQLPLIFVIFSCLIPVLILQKKKRNHKIWFSYITLLLALLVCSNTHVLTGIMFAPKIFQSYSGVVIACILLVILLYPIDVVNQKPDKFPRLCFLFALLCTLIMFEFFKVIFTDSSVLIQLLTTVTLKRFAFLLSSAAIVLGYLYFFREKFSTVLTISLLLTTLYIVMIDEGFSFQDRSFTIKKYPNLTSKEITLLKTKSPFVLITSPDDLFYAQFFPYAIAKMYSPIQSLHYGYFPFMQSCAYNLLYFNSALSYAKNLSLDVKEKTNLIEQLEKNVEINSLITKNIPIKFLNLSYCVEGVPQFYQLNIKDKIQEIKLKVF